MENETTKKPKATKVPTHKLYLNEFFYAIEDSNIRVKVTLEPGNFFIQDGVKVQRPVLTMDFERIWEGNGKTAEEITHNMLQGMRPAKKIITTQGAELLRQFGAQEWLIQETS